MCLTANLKKANAALRTARQKLSNEKPWEINEFPFFFVIEDELMMRRKELIGFEDPDLEDENVTPVHFMCLFKQVKKCDCPAVYGLAS